MPSAATRWEPDLPPAPPLSAGNYFARGPLRDGRALCDRLEEQVIPCFYARNGQFVDVMRYTIALNGSFFNAQRMLQQYVVKAYYE